MAYLAILGPLVLAADLLLFLGSEIVGDVKGLADFLGGLALDHVCDSLASNIEKRLDIEVVRCLRLDVRMSSRWEDRSNSQG